MALPIKILTPLFFLIGSCQTGSTENNSNKETHGHTEIKTCKISKVPFNKTIECSGNMVVLPQNMASLSAPMGGTIKEIKHNVEDYVIEGAILAVLEHQDYIILQQKYLEAKSSFEYYKQDYKRQAELAIENATSIKKMQKAKNEFERYEAILYSMEKQLRMLGINPDSVKSNSIISTINIKSPIKGIIVDMNAHTGKYINENETLFEIVNKDKLFLHLKVPEIEIGKISIGQTISFTCSGSNKKYTSNVNKIGRAVKNSMVDVYSGFLDKNPDFRVGSSVMAFVPLPADSIYMLPASTIIYEGEKAFIFNKNTDKIEIKTGVQKDGFVELIKPNHIILNSEIITEALKYIPLEKK